MSHKVLVLNSSPAGHQSLSRKMVDEFVSQYTAKNPDATFVFRDLSENPLSFVDGTWINAKFLGGTGENEQKVNTLTDNLVDELLESDVIIAGIPVYNLTVPANFKAYIDQVVVAGKTFQYTAEGPKGLVPAGKKIFVMATSGTPYQVLTDYGMNFHGPYLKAIFGFIGIPTVEIVDASARDPESTNIAVETVKTKIAELLV